MRPLDRRGLKSRACSRNFLVNGLRFFWVIAVIWCEVGIVFYSLSGCKWPDKQLMQPESGSTKPTHVLLLSDLHVRHPHAKLSWAGTFRQYVSDHVLRKSWSVASRLKPEAIVSIGDMLASGRLVNSDEEYEQYYKWFRAMFPVDDSVPIYYLPGNNDVGLGRSISFSKDARRRYTKHFGEVNQEISLGGHNFILLDAPGLVEEDYQRHALAQSYDRWTPLPGGPVEFVKSMPAGSRDQPSILFSHIPLSHPDTKSCGPLREQGTLRRGVGVGYQNTLDKQSTEFLLENLRPLAVFSGDDRDYCEYTHTISPPDPDSRNVTRIREVTVKSFSLAKNIRRPGFQLLSLVPRTGRPSPNPDASQTIADVPCFLPDQYAIINSFYIPSLILTILVLLFSNVYRAKNTLRLSPFPSPALLSSHASHPPSPNSDLPKSALWSPWSPMTPSGQGGTDDGYLGHPRRPVSPRSPLPKSLRTPNGPASGAPTYRASSQPVTPHDSPLLTPTVLFSHEEDEDDSMFPPQYAVRREHRPGYSSGSISWPAGYDEEDYGDDAELVGTEKVGSAAKPQSDRGHKRKTSQFLPAPGNKPLERKRWSFSWTFVFRSRRRRMTICAPEIPSLDAIREFGSDLWNWRAGGMRRRGILSGLVGDGISVAWPAAVVWGVIVRWMF